MKQIYININELDFSKPISYYSKIFGLSLNAVRNRFKKLGIYDKFIYSTKNSSVLKSEALQTEYTKNPNKCLNCNLVLNYSNRKNKYCSLKCSAIYSQKDGGHKKWTVLEKEKLRLLAKNNPYFNGEITWQSKINRKSFKDNLKLCKECGISFTLKRKKQICCSRKCFEDWNKKTGYLKGKSGGLREGAGRSKSGWYKGIYCNSSYELAWVIYSIDNNIKFNRNAKSFEYINTKGKISKYYPDFYLTNSKTYVEIKGYKEKEFENKQKYFTEKILVIDKNEIKPIINYVESKYGKNFIELYEGNPHKSKMNNCLICRKPAKNQYCSRVCSGIGVRKIKDSIDKN